MKRGDFYKHSDGGEYVFDCIALPIKDTNLSKKDKEKMCHTHDARHHEKVKFLNVYESGGATFIESDLPHVLYQTKEDFENDTDYMYAREVDNFFGQSEKDSGMTKRFQLMVAPLQLAK